MFTIKMSSPFRSGWRVGLGGPNSGGHQQPHWYIQYGMDLGVRRVLKSLPRLTAGSPDSTHIDLRVTPAKFMGRSYSCVTITTKWAASIPTSPIQAQVFVKARR
jgi:hypothetical protein